MPVVRNCAASIVRRANLTYSASVKLNFGSVADMRSGGSVLEAPPGAEEGALPREHRPQAGCAELTRASSASRKYKLFTYAEKALRYLGEPFLYVLDLAKLNLDGIAAMRSGGSVLKALSAAEGALPREHRPRAGRAELYREHCPQAGCAELARASSACRSCGTVPRALSASRLCRTYASILCVPDSRPAARASASTLEPLVRNF